MGINSGFKGLSSSRNFSLIFLRITNHITSYLRAHYAVHTVILVVTKT